MEQKFVFLFIFIIPLSESRLIFFWTKNLVQYIPTGHWPNEWSAR